MNKIIEWSKNDPIPEILREKKGLAIMLLGTPGVGKTTFIKDFILPKNNNFKIVNPDDISLAYTKDPTGKKWDPRSSDIAVSMIRNAAKSNVNIIYDVTGGSYDRIAAAATFLKQNKYKIIFIHLLGNLDISLSQNKQRERNVDVNFVISSYKRSQSLISRYYHDLSPEAYYIVLNISGQYKFLRYENGKLFRRKTDKYVERESSDD